MALIELNIFSKSLQMQTTVNIIMPQRDDESGQKSFKVLYLLHGLSDDQSIWLRRTSIERYADKYGICVVMPMGARSFYTDMKYGEKYYTYISKELPSVLKWYFNISDKREDTFIAGLSMGGYGSIKIALRNPESFCAVAALSPATDINARKDRDIFKAAFGEVEAAPDEEDLFFLTRQQAKNPEKPRFFAAIGTEDSLYDETARLVSLMKECGYDITYRESAGNHNWDFWDEYIQYALEWMLR